MATVRIQEPWSPVKEAETHVLANFNVVNVKKIVSRVKSKSFDWVL